MLCLFVDAETFSTRELRACGAYRYANDPITELWYFTYALNDAPFELWRPGDPTPDVVIEAVSNPNCEIVAHNAAFDRAIWQHILAPRYGWPGAPIARWRCTMAMARALALPAGLGDLADALELRHRKADNKHMRMMARPRKPRRGEDPAGIYWHDDEANLAKLAEYALQDGEVLRELYRRLRPLIVSEQHLWQLDQIINERGFYTDGELTEAASRVVSAASLAVQGELQQITGGAITSANQLDKLRVWLAERGCEVKDLSKPTLRHALRRKDLDPEARRVIELRLEAAHASAAKMTALRAWRNGDGRVRGTLQFHGAATGRWSGSGPQPQNFRREAGDTEAKIAAVRTRDLETVGRLGAPIDIVGDIARGMICAAPGHRLLIADYSGIESRALAWIAGEQSKLDQWIKFDRSGNPEDEPYFITGTRTFGLLPEQAREPGKTGDIAFGYQGSVGAWQNIAPKDDVSTEAQIEAFKQVWRDQHPRIVQFWHWINYVAIRAVRQPGEVISSKRLTLHYDPPFLFIKLPSGRSLCYPFARIATDRYGNPCVVFLDNSGGKWTDCGHGHGFYGGAFTENVVSGIARDLLAEAIKRLEANGYPIILHVHDELIAELPEGVGDLEEFQRLIEIVPKWAPGLPIKAKVRNGPRFSKSSNNNSDRAEAAQTSDLGTGSGPNVEPTPADADNCQRWATPIVELVGVEPWNIDPENYPPPPPPRNEPDPEPDEPDPEPEPSTQEHRDYDGRDNGHDRDYGHDYDAQERRDGYGRGNGRDHGQQVAFYEYRDARGRNYLGVKRTTTKQFLQYHWGGQGWLSGAPKGPKIPYRLPELLDAAPDALVVVAAGEKDAETAAALGFVATTNSGGEGKGRWTPELSMWFAGRQRVAIMEDNDPTGRAHAIEVATALRSIVPDIRIVTFRELPEHGDLSDWVQAGHGREELVARIEAATAARPAPQPAPIREWAGKPVPQPEYTVPDRFPAEQVCLFSGEGGEGKSTLVQHLCAAHALGRDWLGVEPRPGPAIYLECEDAERVLHWRLAALAGHYGVPIEAFADGGLQLYSLIEHDTILAATNRNGIVETTGFYKWLYELAGDTKPVMLGIASVANVFAGNENARPEVQQFVKQLTRIALVSGGSVLLITHPSMTGIGSSAASHAGLAGSTQWHNAIRARAVLQSIKSEDGAPSPGIRSVTFRKNQYGAISATCFVRWEGGLYLPVEGMSMDAAERAAKAEEVFIALLRRFAAQHQPVGPNSGRNYAPARFAEHPDAQGITKKEFAAAMQRLLDARIIEIRFWGRPSRQTKYLAIVGEN